VLGAAAHHIVYVTVPDLETARAFAGRILSSRLAACVNIVPQVESHYWWKGKVETAEEAILMIKTVSGQLDALEKWMTENHPYDTPEFVAVAVDTGSEEYLGWIRECVRDQTGDRT
jgi:periplasmic divalent cation tolerance protein